MTDNELKRLSRTELLELLISATKENEGLKSQIEELNKQLDEKMISISNAGSIAEASLQLNNVFEAAEAAAQQYLDNVRKCDTICEAKQKEAEKKAKRIVDAAEKKALQIENDAKTKADSYWSAVSERLESFYEEHKG